MESTLAGYRAQRTKIVTADWEVEEGVEPFRATIVTSLSFDQIDAIRMGDGTKYTDLFAAIAPYVLEWNAEAFNVETKEWEPIDAPAIAGPKVLNAVDPSITVFLALKLRSVHMGDPVERPKDVTPSDATPDTPRKNDSTSTEPITKTPRKSRTASTSTSGSISAP